MNARRLAQQLRYRAHRLGWAASLGLVLLLAALFYALVAVRAASARAERFAAAATQANAEIARAATAASGAPAAPATPAEQIGAFYKEFPKGESVPDWLESLYAIAENEKLSLEVGEYLLTKSAGGKLDHFKITLPVKGSYPQLRKFINAALATVPALALDGIYLKRDKVEEGTVDARIVFLLYLEKGA